MPFRFFRHFSGESFRATATWELGHDHDYTDILVSVPKPIQLVRKSRRRAGEQEAGEKGKRPRAHVDAHPGGPERRGAIKYGG